MFTKTFYKEILLIKCHKKGQKSSGKTYWSESTEASKCQVYGY